ncbi:baseplate assembly protein [Hartmannibacter diazotrophicus]|uniref:Baseplate assembly protein n=1 Tax=Hartmannibacter diazotrophicus TaxID=1482074 RepID=A0A2C9D6M2_9HYPH|nr:baseplate J/gp47 family protein [Hartmannibacter diazotrophicus]SON55819.1 baseplate assembly protein [Hartmannibacter diazotrophicus]
MTRFADIDLANLPAPEAVETLDADAIAAERIAELATRLAAIGVPFDTGGLDSEPLAVVEQAGAFAETLLRGRVNDAVRAVLLATATGTDLDQLGAFLGVARLVLTPVDDTATPPTEAVLESDTAFRRRIQLAPEALSVAGPEGAYLALALGTSDAEGALLVKSAAVHSVDASFEAAPAGYRVVDAADALAELLAASADEWIIDDGAGAAPDRFRLPAGHVHVIILSAAGDGAADADLVAAVRAKLSASEVRPIGDFLHVVAASIEPYAIDVTLTVGPGADRSAVATLAEARLAAFADRQHAVGAEVTQAMLAAVASVAGTDGLPVAARIAITSPAADVLPGPFAAPFASSIAVTVEVSDD